MNNLPLPGETDFPCGNLNKMAACSHNATCSSAFAGVAARRDVSDRHGGTA